MLNKFLDKLVSINSIYPNEKKLIDYLTEYFKKNKFNYKLQKVEKLRNNILTTKGNGKKSILLYSHLDTVGIVSGWNTDPFKLTIKNDKAYGLGAWDMKAGLAIALNAFINYNPKNYQLKLALCVDEENISKGGYKLIKTHFMKNVDCILSLEPAFYYGLGGIVTGRIGRAVYDINIEGEAKHFALYDNKYDINYFTARFLTELNKLNKKLEDNKKQFVFARKIHSEATGMSIPSKTFIQLDSSVLPPNTHKKILLQIREIANKLNKQYDNYFKITVEFFKRETPFLEPYEIRKTNHYLRKYSQSVKSITGLTTYPYFRSSVADENIFGSHGYCVLGVGPEGGNAHAANEWVSLSSMEKLYNILIDFLKRSDSS